MKREEAQIQAAAWQHYQLRKMPGTMLFAVNNNPRNKIQGSLLKRMGCMAGVPDFIGLSPKVALAIEVKTMTGRATESQIQFLNAWEKAGGKGFVCNGLEKILFVLKEWGFLR